MSLDDCWGSASWPFLTHREAKSRTAFPFIWNPAVKGCRLNRRGLDRFRMAGLMTNGEICLPRDLIAHLDYAVRVLLG